MVFSSVPCDINSIEEILPTFARYDISYNIDNVQPTHEGGHEMDILDVDGVDEEDVIEVQLKNLLKQKLAWKFHYCNSVTWAFKKVNDTQLVDLFQNKIMRCIICHSDTTPFEILAMHTRCRKGFIAYHKSNVIIAMKKHVEYDYFYFVEKNIRRCSKPCPKIST
jgi:hypothetical protein